MRMLRRIKDVTLRDKIRERESQRNKTPLVWTDAENGRKQRSESSVDMIVPEKKPKGRPRGRWVDCVRRDMQTLRITPEDAQDRTFWK